MARTSKRRFCLENQMGKEEGVGKAYAAGIYARLSVEHHDGKEASIENQIALAKKYLKSHGEMTLYDCYCDLGATGTNFIRPDFERLMEDIRDERVNCVIVKDFSRFGRNYIETGDFVEKIFPFMGVRFISITDQYDSMDRLTGNEALSVHLKNIANEFYARDIGKKAAAGKRLKMERGEFVGSVAPYGYTVGMRNGKRTLIREKAGSEIVRQIFVRYDAGETFSSLIEWLYGQGIHRPSDHRKYQTVCQKEGQELKQWDTTVLRTILSNQAYLGSLVQSGKYMDEPVAVEHTHEPLVTEEVFYRVGERLKGNCRMQKCTRRSGKAAEDIFRGVLYCGECGRRLVRMAHGKKSFGEETERFVFYSCPNRRRIDGEHCAGGYITFLRLQKIILHILKEEFARCGVSLKMLLNHSNAETQKQKMFIQKKQEELQRAMEGKALQMSGVYLEYKEGRISQTQFLRQKQLLVQERGKVRQKLSLLHTKASLMDGQAERQNQLISALVQCADGGKLDACLVESLIEQIFIYQGKRAVIVWRWRDTAQKTQEGMHGKGSCDEALWNGGAG